MKLHRHAVPRLHRRAGLALIVMLIALGIVSAICLTLLKMSLAERQHVRRETLATQADWLAESGVDLAAELLQRDANSTGTTWNIPAEQLGGSHAAVVTVKIAPVENSPNRRQVTVVAEYPAKSPLPIRPQVVRFVDL